MDLQHTPSHAPVRDAEPLPASAFEPPAADAAQFAHPDADVRMAERQRKEKALGALEVQIMELWGNINAATARFLELVAEFDRREGWAQHGMASCAQWLSWQCGIGRVAATEKVRTARALESLPKISEAFGEGSSVVFEGARAHAGGDGGDGGHAAAHCPERHGGACGTYGTGFSAG